MSDRLYRVARAVVATIIVSVMYLWLAAYMVFVFVISEALSGCTHRYVGIVSALVFGFGSGLPMALWLGGFAGRINGKVERWLNISPKTYHAND